MSQRGGWTFESMLSIAWNVLELMMQVMTLKVLISMNSNATAFCTLTSRAVSERK